MTDHDDTTDDFAATRAIAALLRSRPAGDASNEERAAWFDRKAEVFELIAAREPWLANRSTAVAAIARAEAARLRGEGPR